jgi:hypothetical protein
MAGELERRVEVAEVVDRLSDGDLGGRERGRLLAQLTALITGGVRAAGARAALTGRYLSDLVAEIAPHVVVRDLPTLRAHYGGLSGEELADALVRQAARATAGVGAAGGALAAVQHTAPPSLVVAPVQLAAETVAVVATELKLVAELHVVYGRAPVAPGPELAAAYLHAWARRTPADPSGAVPDLGTVLGAAARQQLRRRVARRLARNATTLAPFLTGALAGAELNRRETRSLADQLRHGLRLRRR